ncbi:MAG: helix-turn-helix transcriptional regulator [Bacteroidota bacterium]
MKGDYLGEFEEIVMLAAATLYDEAYGYAIQREITANSSRTPSLGAVHAALHRLESKGFLQSRLSEATTKRGGKKRRFFSLTSYGKRALETKRNLRESMWRKIPKIVFEDLE